MMRQIVFNRVGCILLLAAQMATADVPATLSHQGVIAVNGERFTGQGDFWFALINPANGENLWTNDGTQVGEQDQQPDAAVSLVLVNGIYNVRLGDGGMPDIDSSVFDTPDVALRVWFDDGLNGSHMLTPDQPIASVPYAYHSATIADDAVTSVKITDGQVMSVDLADDAVSSAKIQNGTVTAADLATNSVGSAEIASSAVGSDEIANNAVTSGEIADGQVDNADLAPNAVSSGKIQNGTVTAADLATNSVGSAEIASSAVGSGEIASNAVTSAKIASNAVTSAKIASNAVTSSDIAGNSVTSSDLASDTASLNKVSGGIMTISGGDVTINGLLHLDVGGVLPSSTDENLEFFQVVDGECNASTRGAMAIRRVTDVPGAVNQDCLCVCLLKNNPNVIYRWACFAP